MILVELLSIMEARKAELSYEEKKVKGALDRVILSLQGNQSGKFTKLISNYKKIQKAVEALAKKQGELNAHLKEEVEDLFDAEDEVYTRVVDTISATLTLSKKQSVTTTKIDYEAILAKITELQPELEEKIKELTTEFTKVTTAEKSPALRTTIKEAESLEEGLKELAKYVKDIAKAALSAIKGWGKSYDKKLEKIVAELK
jgi:CRISPR/Cas system CSM-associated protein Csm2 small subunit